MSTSNAPSAAEPAKGEAGDSLAHRKRWMAVLARSATADLESQWQALHPDVGYQMLRAPESGMAMVRARIGGNGGQFNLGEMTVTRCSVCLDNGTIGHAYVAGRDRRRAELAAAFDALLQDPSRRPEIIRKVIEPLAAKRASARGRRSRKAAATKVDFFTLIRGEDT